MNLSFLDYPIWNVVSGTSFRLEWLFNCGFLINLTLKQTLPGTLFKDMSSF